MFGNSFIFLIFGFIYLLSFILWIWTLIDCVKKETDKGNTRLIWVIIIVFTYIVGAFIYYLIRRPKRIQELGK
ncbi:PLDc_N domain-containing protein [Methanosarcina sp. KYL-1]|uniref:PLDc N-terminal domain-containing protein n=1 Tax=Methanosarcina sp. KYL-1 TaxID=2602068 RepID=UPI0021018AF4|nr:PLD nuclease N-terminal domain-containing protein [Methanosarcina sp. KYL-1]MCQ1534754.1 PLDc_N domain-containing protein [Methanosarcina sp. KYL-1]